MIKNFLFTKRKLLIGVAVAAGVIAIYPVLYRTIPKLEETMPNGKVTI